MTDNHITGSIVRKAGKYYANIYYYIGGKRHVKSFPTGIPTEEHNRRKAAQNERSARKMLAEIIRSFEVPTTEISSPLPSDQLFCDAVRDWLAKQPSLISPSSLAGYTYSANDVIEYFTLFPLKISEVTERTVESYIVWERTRRQPNYIPKPGESKKRTRSSDGAGIDNTIMRRIAVIRSVLQDAKRDGIITRNPASKSDSWVRLPKIQAPSFQVLDLNEAKTLLEAYQDEPLWFKTAIYLGLVYGLRRSEVFGIRTQDIDFAQRRLTIRNIVTQQTINGQNVMAARPSTKAKKSKSFIISPEILTSIEELISQNQKNAQLFGRSYCHDWDGYIFRDPDGKLISPNRLTQRFRTSLIEKGLKRVRFHDLRHSCASILYSLGISAKTIQLILGHTQLATTTEIYTHLFGGEAEDALTLLAQLLLDSSAELDAELVKFDRNFDRKTDET